MTGTAKTSGDYNGSVLYTATLTDNTKKYTITFDGNGGSEVRWKPIVTGGQPIGTLPISARSGYEFAGWFPAKDSGDPITENTIVPAHDITYYARWNPVYEFGYTGKIQTFTAPETGTYKLEAWGAQGGYGVDNGITRTDQTNLATGGYSEGYIHLSKGQILYIAVGGRGNPSVRANAVGGWNGGGNGSWDRAGNDADGAGSGGGATSIQAISRNDGQLKNYENIKDSGVLLVAGGGGGIDDLEQKVSVSGNGGGSSGVAGVPSKDTVDRGTTTKNSVPGTQTSGFAFGQGQNASAINNNSEVGGGGGGWYGGFAGQDKENNTFCSGAGGSGHVSALMSNGKTISGDNRFLSPSGSITTGNAGNGYARIIYESTNDSASDKERWKTISGNVYYGTTDNNSTYWRYLENHYYYFGTDGKMETGWKQVNGQWYYMDSYGVMQTGLQTIDGGLYYLNSSGAMMTGFQTVSGNTYYFYPSGGAAASGWANINGKYYHFSSDHLMTTGWYKEGSYWYYLTTASDSTSWGNNYPVGSMLANTYMDQNGKRYTFDSEGHCQNP